ncbi:MAG: hypothetical protein ACI9FB_001732 [Candidatus Azotimanducaceae bacterium]|jgi:hypothetical protein
MDYRYIERTPSGKQCKACEITRLVLIMTIIVVMSIIIAVGLFTRI